MGKRKRRKETYYQKWRREHPRLQLYLSRDEYELLKRIAEDKNVSMKELILNAIKGARMRWRKAYLRGFKEALDKFIDEPHSFYWDVRERVEERGLRGFEPCLFTSQCKYCGRPMVFTHKDGNYDEVKKYVREAFKNWYHVKWRLHKLYSLVTWMQKR